jgi:hypothetical protein
MPGSISNASENANFLCNRSFVLFCFARVATTLAYQM